MKKAYSSHDGHVHAGDFNKWIMSSDGIRKIYERVDPNLDRTSIYRFKDATVEYWCSGSHRDGAPVEIIVEGDTSGLVEQICATLVKRFPRVVEE